MVIAFDLERLTTQSTCSNGHELVEDNKVKSQLQDVAEALNGVSNA